MEISKDLLSITGILVNAKLKFGDLSEVTYIKGLNENETKISYVIESLRSFLKEKGYLNEDTPKPEFQNYFEQFSLLFIVNCEFSKDICFEEYAHLTYNVPKISKYLFTVIILNLDITRYFSSVLKKLPLIYSSELLDEFIFSLDKVKLVQRSNDAYLILQGIAEIILQNRDKKYSDEMDNIMRTVPNFFIRFCKIPVDAVQKLKKEMIFTQAGYVLQKLLHLLLFCHENDFLSGSFINELIQSTTTVVQAISVDMFIHWAEIDLDSGQSLQNEIAENSYMVIWKFRQLESATEMVDSLQPFSSKPKSIREQINMSDTNKIIGMIERKNQDQKQWLNALIFSEFFTNEKAIECISKWSHLCTEDDVSRIINLSLNYDNKVAKDLVLKCASVLNLELLIVVVVRHFYRNKFVVLYSDVHAELVLFFNMLKDCESLNENNMMQLLLILLKNPTTTIMFILSECVKSVFYVNVLKECFKKFVDVLQVHNIMYDSLDKVMESSPPNDRNLANYVELLQLFLDINLISIDKYLLQFANHQVENVEDNYEDLCYRFKIFNGLNISVQVNENLGLFFRFLIITLRKRPTIFNFNAAILAVIKEVVYFIKNKIDRNSVTDLAMLDEIEEDQFISYYKNRLKDLHEEESFLEHVVGSNLDDSTKIVCRLMQVLPSSINDEWFAVCSEIVKKTNCKKLFEILEKMMKLLSVFSKSQENSENIIEAVKYCVQEIGIFIKNNVLVSSEISDELLVTETLINLLTFIPQSVKESEGLNLTNMMSDKSLKLLGDQTIIITKICNIKNTTICQVIANKILSK